MDALKLRKDVSKPSLLRVVREVFDTVIEEVCGLEVFHRRLSDVGAGGVSGEARLAVAVWSIDTQAFGGGSESASSVRSGSGSLRHDPAPSRLDPISPVRYRKAFQQVLQRAQRGKVPRRMSAWHGHDLVAVDGIGTFSSQRIHGLCCLRARRHRATTVQFDHVRSAVVVCGCAVLVHPDQRQVLPLAMVTVRNGDGSTKNNCERGAWTRLLQEHGLRFLLVAARAGDHPHLQTQLDRSNVALVCGSLARGSGAGPPAGGGAGCGTECYEPRSEGPGAAEFRAARMRGGSSPGSRICRSARTTPANWPGSLRRRKIGVHFLG